jgi:hypothetical protein
MGVRTRGVDIATNAKRQLADAAARAEAKAVIDRWNEQLAASRDMLWSPTIRAALIAGTPWLDVFCPGCGTSRAIDLRKVDRHSLASVATLVLGLRCSWCPESAPNAEDPRFARAPAGGEGRGVSMILPCSVLAKFGPAPAPMPAFGPRMVCTKPKFPVGAGPSTLVESRKSQRLIAGH